MVNRSDLDAGETVCGLISEPNPLIDTRFAGPSTPVHEFFGATGDPTVAVRTADDGLIVGGSVFGRTLKPTTAFVLARFDREGRRDTSFGEGGSTVTGRADATTSLDFLHALADGRIVAIGSVHERKMTFPCLTATGEPDRRHGRRGAMVVHTGIRYNETSTAVRTRDDAVITIGWSRTTHGDRTVIARLAPPDLSAIPTNR
jgi:hypothetical protein